MKNTSFPGFRHPGPLIERPAVGSWVFPALAVLALAGIFLMGHAVRKSYSPAEVQAAAVMAETCSIVRARRAAEGWRPDLSIDPNRTGMLGEEYTPYTTTIGEIQAKRTSTDPSMAMLMVRLFEETGAKEGDVVAIGASGSFPSLLVATLAAAKALGLRPLVAASVGASQWGANSEGYTLIELLDWIRLSPVSGFEVVGLTLGGEGDSGLGYEPEFRDRLAKRIEAVGFPSWASPSIRDSVQERMLRFEAARRGRRLACYVNIGGNEANMGTGLDVLSLKPGIASPDWRNVPRKDWGVLHEMAAQGIPTIHLLYIKGLAVRYALPWDPSPLMDPEGLRTQVRGLNDMLPLISSVYLATFLAVIMLGRFFREGKQTRSSAAIKEKDALKRLASRGIDESHRDSSP